MGLLAMGSQALAFTPRPVPGRLLLELHDWAAVGGALGKPGGGAAVTGQAGLDRLNARFGVHAFRPQFPGETPASKALAGQDLSRFFVLEFDPGQDLDAVRAAYAADPAVQGAAFDMLAPLDIDPNDAGSQWYLESSLGHDAHVPGGWNHTQGDSTVLLAIADSGVDWQHPDLGGTGPDYLNGSVWINWPERNGLPGVDDDANGYIDDVRGWDFVSSLSGAWPGEDAIAEDNDPRDFNGHGTHVAGIAGAVTNNGVGVAGVGWRCRVMALRIGGSINDGGVEQGVVLMSSAASALNYARQKGAAAFNCSWGSVYTPSLAAAVAAAINQGMVVVVAAGNDGSQGASYLSQRGDCFDVAATTNLDNVAGFSNYGTWIDVAAPGVAIYNTWFNHNAGGEAQHTYASLQGTSMAAPVVTGLVGLVKAKTPAYTGTQIKLTILMGCDNIDALNPGYGGKLGAGRVNALRTFRDYNLRVPQEYANFDKAFAASGTGDTLTLRGGDIYTTGWYVWRSNRLIEGGWNASFTVRDPVNNPTLVQRTGTGPALEFVPGIDASLILDGVSFSGGSARNLSSPLAGDYGGGILCIDASPVLLNCRFTGNTAGDLYTFGGGGGGFFSNSAAVLVDCVFTANSAQAGAGLFLYNATVRIEGGSIHGNPLFDAASTTTGGGLYVEGGAPILDGVTIADHAGADEGGGMYVKSTTVSAHGVLFSNNAATNSGGQVRLGTGGGVVLRACELRAGAAPFGAGLAVTSGATFDLASCVVADNVASFLGSGIYSLGATGTLVNVTFQGNRATAGGADAIYGGSCPGAWTLRNCLVTGHPTATNAACLFTGVAPQLDYNTFWNNAGGNVNGGTLGPHDAVADPLYVNAAAGDVALGLHSPALDAGDPALFDPDGTPSDRGAYGGQDAASRAPLPATALQVARGTNPPYNTVDWTASASPDVQFYAVYRGANSGFVPSATTYAASVATGTTVWSDPTGDIGSWYRVAAVDSSGACSGFTPAVQTTTTDAPPSAWRFALHGNTPNPFNPSTRLRFELPAAAHVRLDLFDAAGRRMRRFVDAVLPAGAHAVAWDGRDAAGRDLGSGVYIVRLEAGSQRASRKITLVR